jgi:hypothetical protein
LATDGGRQSETLSQIGDDLVKVERDRPTVDLSPRPTPVDDRDERLIGRSVGFLPSGLDLRGGQRFLGRFFGHAVQRPRGWAGERLELCGQARLELGLDVDVRVQLVDQITGQGSADGLLLQ